jgi:transposase
VIISQNGISHHNVQKKHYKQKAAEIKEWLEVRYPDIVEKANAENAEIWWLDEVGLQNTSNYVKGYSPRGVTPVVPVATKYIRVNMISAITNKGKLRFHFYKGKMNQNAFKSFLIKLITSTDKKVYAISDNLPAHHGLRLQAWLEKKTDKIRLFFLPSYAPELNPVEYLNNNLKFEAERKGYCKDEKEIQKNAMSVMRSLTSKKDRIVAFFENEKVKYANNDE